MKNHGHPKSFHPSSFNPQNLNESQVFVKSKKSSSSNNNNSNSNSHISYNHQSTPKQDLIPVHMDTSRMREQLKQLNKQLEQTNDEIARQELKIALNNKTKNYERPKKK